MRFSSGAVALLVVPLLAACVSIPTSGPIQQGVEVGVENTDQVIRVIARPPQPDMTPTEIVSGFLQASASFEDDHAIGHGEPFRGSARDHHHGMPAA